MRRRHVLALIVLALVAATVMAMGPVRVWDSLTLRTVEEYWPNGQIKLRYDLRWWDSVDEVSWLPGMPRRRLDSWHENGQKEWEIRYQPILDMRCWSETGRLTTHIVAGKGIMTITEPVLEQQRYKDDEVVETRTSPPWFTEEEILQSVEGVEE